MQRFGAPGGLGETLQQKLLEQQEKTANWVRITGRKLMGQQGIHDWETGGRHGDRGIWMKER